MLQFIPSADNVIAVSIEHRITSADLVAMMDRLDACLAANDTVHVFVETRSLDAIEVSGLGAHIARAMPLFGQLRRFGRVAVVDQLAAILMLRFARQHGGGGRPDAVARTGLRPRNAARDARLAAPAAAAPGARAGTVRGGGGALPGAAGVSSVTRPAG